MPYVRLMTVALALGLAVGAAPAALAQQPGPGLAARVRALEAKVAALEAALAALGRHVRVEQGSINGLPGPHLILTGVNLHLRSGSGQTDDGIRNEGGEVVGTPRGLGNLVVGYNEAPPELQGGDRGGSHNLILGPQHRYSSVVGLVAGELHTVRGVFATVSGGFGNTASRAGASVSGGADNTAGGRYSSVSGGFFNTAGGELASISGGSHNSAGDVASVTGDQHNTASGFLATVTGGAGNTASGDRTSVSGGNGHTASGEFDWVAGDLFQED
jgi:trimeric autotransporter adhesin